MNKRPVIPPQPTTRQSQYLAFIQTYTILVGCAPSEEEMQHFFQVAPSTVHQMILTLETRGFISRVPGQARTIQVLSLNETLAEAIRPFVQKRKTLSPGEKLPLTFSARERDLVLSEVSPPRDLEKRIRMSVIEKNQLVARFTLDELEELAGYVAAYANHATNRKLQQELDRLFSRIQGLLDSHDDQS